jgi:AcrR family transcriptional regulator
LIQAATELFLRRGYAATTLADVAAHAGLAARTVYLRFATKADLLRRCIDVAIAGDAEPVPIADRSWMTEAMTAPTLDQRIRLMASITATLMARAGPLLDVAQQAAATEPAIAAAAQAGRADTTRTLAEFWRRAAEDGLVPRRCDLAWLTDTATLLAHAETYLLLTKTTAWDIPTYQAWLETTWHRLVRGGTAAQRPAPGRS